MIHKIQQVKFRFGVDVPIWQNECKYQWFLKNRLEFCLNVHVVSSSFLFTTEVKRLTEDVIKAAIKRNRPFYVFPVQYIMMLQYLLLLISYTVYVLS